MYVSALHFYPVKSLGGIAPAAWTLEPSGPRLDRRFMLVDAQGMFVTQRTLPKLCLVSTELTEDTLLLRAPGMELLGVPLASQGGASRQASVWGFQTEAEDVGDAAAAWFSAFAQQDLRLVRFPDADVRRVDPRYAVDEHFVAFADAYPVLLAGEASLADLNARLAEPVPMSRFRPNVVIADAPAFYEDGVQRLKLGSDVILRVVKPCERCVVTTIDHATALPGKEPLRTLAKFRTQNGKVVFGQNCLVERPGLVRVGDAVTPLE